MSLTETTQDSGPQVNVNPTSLLESARSLWNLIQRFLGAVLVLAALGLWVFPGASWATDVALFKLGLSLALGFSGLALWQMGTCAQRLDIQVDPNTHEVQLVATLMGKGIPILNCTFTDFDRVDRDGDRLILRNASGAVFAEVEMKHAEVRKRLVATLEKTPLMDAQKAA